MPGQAAFLREPAGRAVSGLGFLCCAVMRTRMRTCAILGTTQELGASICRLIKKCESARTLYRHVYYVPIFCSVSSRYLQSPVASIGDRDVSLQGARCIQRAVTPLSPRVTLSCLHLPLLCLHVSLSRASTCHSFASTCHPLVLPRVTPLPPARHGSRARVPPRVPTE